MTATSHTPGRGRHPGAALAGAEDFGAALRLLVDLVFGEAHQQALLPLRPQAFLDELDPIDLTEAQQRIASTVNLRVEALLPHSFQGLSRWQTALRCITNELEDLERRAKWDRFGEGGTRRSAGSPVHTSILTRMRAGTRVHELWD